jgi:Poly (ADP-ribose) glycohydrolase (PARG)
MHRVMAIAPDPIERHEYDTLALMAQHPPVWRDPNKQVVFDVACRPGDSHGGQLGYSRWAAMALPDGIELVTAGELVLDRDGYFDYEPVLDPADGIEWHVNFADSQVFGYYGSALFAQDEMQVAEHPALGALREALVAGGQRAVTMDRGEPTPVLVTGVERRCRIATDPNDPEGRPHGLYGNAFARARPDAIARATTRIDPPTITNLIAIAAPAGGRGRYRRAEIELVLVTAFKGFRAAVLESERARGDGVRVAVHTGYWGCGAFGGNRVLMALLQVVAARMAGLDRLAFHTGAPGGRGPLDEALRLVGKEAAAGTSSTTADLIVRMEAMGFEWGVSDGN